MTSRNRPEGKGDGRLLTATPDGSEAGPATRAVFDGGIGGLTPPPAKISDLPAAIKKRNGGSTFYVPMH